MPSDSHRLLMERSANYARVLSLGLNISTRAEVTYPPIIGPGDSFFLDGATSNCREDVVLADLENYLEND